MACTALAGGCREPRFPAVPGDTNVSVTSVSVEGRGGEHVDLDFGPLFGTLGLRAKSALLPARDFNAFRLAEDRRRVTAYMQEHGRFDAEVDEPRLEYSPDLRSVAVTWTVHEGEVYTIQSVVVQGAPPEEDEELHAMVPFGVGDQLDLPAYRGVRELMAEHMQAAGYGHARAYSRVYVDRGAKGIAWFYYCDPGPRTRVGSLVVEGNRNLPAAAILKRAGLKIGAPFSTEAAHRAELALLDTGAFASAAVVTDADIQRLPEFPDSGGVLAPERVSSDGELVPRHLPEDLSVRVVVVESPMRQGRGELGLEGDPTRVDAFTSARVVFRNLFAPQNHLVLEGTAGYGWLTGAGSRSDQLAGGVYGSALAQYQRPGALGRTIDLRITARWRDELYPAAVLSEFVAGPGLRTTLAPGVFFDVDAFARFARTEQQPALDPASTAGFALPMSTDSSGAELVASIIADHRDDRVEPTRGWLLGLGAQYSPGGPFGDDRWLTLTPDARLIHHLGNVAGPWSLALRGSGGVVVAAGDSGVPLGARLFGGGAYGFRGFGRDQLSPSACVVATACQSVLVGGRSLFESSAELRFLPFRKQYGLATFVDAGAAGAGVNAFADGVSIAYGVGARVRLWYLPIALDLAYRVVDKDDAGLAWGRVLGFVRVGEAF
jgi:outer membrane translocation and assembly module TamA